MTGDQRTKFLNIRVDFLICLFLIVSIIIVYWQVRNFSFVNYDDEKYVAFNHTVKAGLTFKSVTWAFYTTYFSNWHPLTWLSHMLDVQLYGMNPGQHHLTNVLIHILNTILCFLFFNKATGHIFRSGFIAALFALHPLHVESVAWISERKDVLSTFFWMSTLLSYVMYVEQKSIRRYMLTLLCFILGLMAKPMLVTLPLVMLLLDYWPLGRYPFTEMRSKSHQDSGVRLFNVFLRLFYEKLPFIIFTAVSIWMTLLAQISGGAVRSFDTFSPGVRIANAFVSYMGYIGKMIWPSHLAIFYPHPGMPPIWQIVCAGILFLGITILALYFARSSPWLMMGWLWYLGTLVPVIGLVQIGGQAMADRYTYVPLIGLFIMIIWGISELVKKWGDRGRKVMTITSAAILITLMAKAHYQVGTWENSISLFEHALTVTSNNDLAHNNLGLAKYREGKLDEAILQYDEALRIDPDFAHAHNNLGIAMEKSRKVDEAIEHYRQAIRIYPGFAEAHNNLGTALAGKGILNEAISHYSAALKEKSDFVKAHNNFGLALMRNGKLKTAIDQFRKAIKIEPDNVDAVKNYRLALKFFRRIEAAAINLKESLNFGPEESDMHHKFEILNQNKKELNRAMDSYMDALSTQPGFNPKHVDFMNMAIINNTDKKYEGALLLFKKIRKRYPGEANACYHIASIYSMKNMREEALFWLKKAVHNGFRDMELLKIDKHFKSIRKSTLP